MKMIRIYKKITASDTWKDPVWASVISSGISAFFATCTAFLMGLSVNDIWLFIQIYWQVILNILFLVIIISLWRENRKLKISESGLNWVLSLPSDKYDVLMWFPINNTVIFKDSRNSDLMSKPLFKDLVDHKVLIPLALSNDYEIDRKVFDHYEKQSMSLDEWDRSEYVGGNEIFKGCFY